MPERALRGHASTTVCCEPAFGLGHIFVFVAWMDEMFDFVCRTGNIKTAAFLLGHP